MPYPQFNSWNIVPMPTTPAFRTLTLSMQESVGQTQSPFTMASQVQAWPGADWWEAEIALPPMPRAKALPWIAFLAALRGKSNVFQLGDPLGTKPQGAGSPIPVYFNGAHLATATSINTKGWVPNAIAVLQPGDYLQIGYRLHMVAGVSTINADANGDASFDIWPSLREPHPDFDPITTSSTTGLFRLADNKRTWSANESKLYGISFKAVEAR